MEWSDTLSRVIKGERLTSFEASSLMKDVLNGNASSVQLAGLLCVLRARGETVDELVGMSNSMLEAALPIEGMTTSLRDRLVDTCGTGGDRSGTINVSTMAALVVAAAGVPVCKHGNRAASSQTGTADVLEALGVELSLDGNGVLACIEKAGIGFCMATKFHPAMKHVAPTRRELGVPTAFNFLGPLSNPSRLRRQVIGVSDPRYAELMLGVLKVRGSIHAIVAYGHDGLDEITTTTLSTIFELRNGEINRYDLDPTSLGLSFADPKALRGGDALNNADVVRKVLDGEQSAHSEIVALNAAAGLIVGGVVDDFKSGVELATDILHQGRAAKVLDELVSASNGEL